MLAHTSQVFASKRKPFNMAKQRLAGTDAAPLAKASAKTSTMKAGGGAAAGGGGGKGGGGSIAPGGGTPKWKAQVGGAVAWCYWGSVMPGVQEAGSWWAWL